MSGKLASWKGLLFCSVCGCLSTVKLCNLSRPCTGSANSHGTQNLKQISQGLLPKDVEQWPHDELIGIEAVKAALQQAEDEHHLANVQSQVAALSCAQFEEALSRAPSLPELLEHD